MFLNLWVPGNDGFVWCINNNIYKNIIPKNPENQKNNLFGVILQRKRPSQIWKLKKLKGKKKKIIAQTYFYRIGTRHFQKIEVVRPRVIPGNHRNMVTNFLDHSVLEVLNGNVIFTSFTI